MARQKKVRVQLYMPEELIKDIDNYALNMGIARSNVITFWCAQQIIADKIVAVMDEVIDTCNRLKSGNEDNSELIQKLNRLMGVSELYKEAVSEVKN